MTIKSLNTYLITLALAMSSLTTTAYAGLMSTDFTSTDGTFTSKANIDTDTGLEWMQVRSTMGLSFNEVTAMLDTTLLGWRTPTNEEVEIFFTNNFKRLNITGNTTTYSYISCGITHCLASSEFRSAGQQFSSVYGVGFSKNNLTQFALYKDKDSILRRIGASSRSNRFNIHGLEDTSSFDDDYTNAKYGVLLVSDNLQVAVPEPATLFPFGFALMFMVLRKFKTASK